MLLKEKFAQLAAGSQHRSGSHLPKPSPRPLEAEDDEEEWIRDVVKQMRKNIEHEKLKCSNPAFTVDGDRLRWIRKRFRLDHEHEDTIYCIGCMLNCYEAHSQRVHKSEEEFSNIEQDENSAYWQDIRKLEESNYKKREKARRGRFDDEFHSKQLDLKRSHMMGSVYSPGRTKQKRLVHASLAQCIQDLIVIGAQPTDDWKMHAWPEAEALRRILLFAPYLGHLLVQAIEYWFESEKLTRRDQAKAHWLAANNHREKITDTVARPMAVLLEGYGVIEIPDGHTNMRKLPKWTPQFPETFPAIIDGRWLVSQLGHQLIEDQDLRGWTPLHHLCDSAGYCAYPGSILVKLFERPTANYTLFLPGDMDKALKTYTRTLPEGRTPLHLLFDNSDSGMDANTVLQNGLTANIITLEILNMTDPHVSVFLFRHYCTQQTRIFDVFAPAPAHVPAPAPAPPDARPTAHANAPAPAPT